MSIPNKLRIEGIRFVLVESKGKKPFQKDWTNKNIYWDNEELNNHLQKGGNYGVIGGGEKNLLIVDFDDKKVQQEVVKKLPKTFTVKTGSGLLHKYFFSDNSESFKIFDEKLNTLADVQGEGKQVIGAGSIHPNGNTYSIVDNKDIAFIDYAELKAILMPYDKKPKKQKVEKKENADFDNEFVDEIKSKISMPSLLSDLGIDTTKNPTNCPFHASDKGKCLGFLDETAHCFHCDDSWNIFSMIMQEKNCNYAEALDYFAEKEGLVDELKESRKKWVKGNKQEEIVDEVKEEKLPKLSEEESKEKLKESYDLIIRILKEYCDLREDYYSLIAIWIIGTHFHDGFVTYPYLFFNAMKGSGKTRITRLISHLARNGKIVSNMSEAVLFRTAKGRTLCIDEFERVSSKDKGSLRELLNCAYKRGMKVERMIKKKSIDGEEQVVEEFDVFCPVVMANITGMDEVLGDRCIKLILERSNSYITKMVEIFDSDSNILDFKTKVCSLCNVVLQKNIYLEWNNYIKALNNNYISTLTTLTTLTTQTTYFNKINEKNIFSGRTLELFFPLFIIAEKIGILDKIIEIAEKIIKEKQDVDSYESRDISLIDFVSQRNNEEWIKIKILLQEFVLFLELSPDEAKWINNRWFGRALQRLSLTKEKRRKTNGIEVILNVEKAKKKIKMFKNVEPKDPTVSTPESHSKKLNNLESYSKKQNEDNGVLNIKPEKI